MTLRSREKAAGPYGLCATHSCSAANAAKTQPNPAGLGGVYNHYGRLVIFGNCIGSAGSKRPKAKTAVAEAMATYWRPSTA